MTKTTVILVFGYPSTGKTTLAHLLAEELGLPLVWKDGIKETLMDALADEVGDWTIEWSRALGRAAFELLYQQIETLLRAGVDMIVESTFDPAFANPRWQSLTERYSLRVIQVRCHTEPAVRLARYQARIASGARHPGHMNDPSAERRAGRSEPPDWLEVPGLQIAVDTTTMSIVDYSTIAGQVQEYW